MGEVSDAFVLFRIVMLFTYRTQSGGISRYIQDHERLEVCWIDVIWGDNRYTYNTSYDPLHLIGRISALEQERLSQSSTQ